MDEILAERLAETCFLTLPAIAQRARTWGLVVEEDEGQFTFRSPGGLVSGFSEATDPVNRAVILAMALVGMCWPWAFPSLLKRVQQRWKVVGKQ